MPLHRARNNMIFKRRVRACRPVGELFRRAEQSLRSRSSTASPRSPSLFGDGVGVGRIFRSSNVVLFGGDGDVKTSRLAAARIYAHPNAVDKFGSSLFRQLREQLNRNTLIDFPHQHKSPHALLEFAAATRCFLTGRGLRPR